MKESGRILFAVLLPATSTRRAWRWFRPPRHRLARILHLVVAILVARRHLATLAARRHLVTLVAIRLQVAATLVARRHLVTLVVIHRLEAHHRQAIQAIHLQAIQAIHRQAHHRLPPMGDRHQTLMVLRLDTHKPTLHRAAILLQGARLLQR